MKINNYLRFSWLQSLRFTLLFPLVLLVIGALIFHGLRWEWQTRELLDEWSGDDAEDFAGSISVALETIPEKDWNRFIISLGASRKIRSIAVSLDTMETINLSNDLTRFNQPLGDLVGPDFQKRFQRIKSGEIQSDAWIENGTRNFLLPLRVVLSKNLDSRVSNGLIFLSLEDRQTQEHLARARRSGILTAILLVFLITGGGLWILQKFLFSRLDEIKKVMNRWVRGETEIRVITNGKNEIDRIGRVLNQNMDSLTKANDLFQSLFQSSIVGVMVTMTSPPQIIRANKAFLDMLGYTETDLPLDWERMTPPDWAEADKKGLASLIARKTTFPWEKEYYRKDGSRLPILIGGTPIKNQPDHQICFVIDITDRKIREREITKSSWLVGERVKELQTIHNMSHVFEKMDQPLSQLLQKAVDLIGLGMQFPEIAATRIVFRGETFTSSNPLPFLYEFNTPIETEAGKDGSITVGYTGDLPKRRWAQEPFLPEEFDLVKTLAKMIATRIAAHEKQLQLEKSESRSRILLETFPHGIVIVDPATRKLEMGNQAFQKMFGLTEADLAGFFLVETLHPANALSQIKMAFERMAQGDMRPVRAIPCLKKDGTEFRCDITPAFVKLDNRKCLLAYFTEVTATYQAHKDLEKSQKDLFKAQNIGRMGSWNYDKSSKKFTISSPLRDLIHWNENELTREDFRKIVFPEDLPIVLLNWQQADNGHGYDSEYRVVIDNEQRWFHSTSEPQVDSTGQVTEIMGITQDITQQKLGEEQLKYQATLLKETGRIAKVGGWRLQVDTLTGFWSEIAAEIFEVEHEAQLPIADLLNFFTSASRPLIEKAIQDAIHDKKPYDLELEIITRKSTPKWIRAVGYPVIEKGKAVSLHGALQDITQRIQVQDDLKREKILFQAILTTIPDPIWFKDADGVYRFCNERFAKMFGRQETDVLGRTDYELSSPSLAVGFRAKDLEALKSPQPIQYEEWRTFPQDGTRELLEIRKVATVDPSGKLIGILGLGRDITSQRKARESLERFSVELEERVQKRTSELALKNREFEYVISSIPDTVLRVNDQGMITFFKESTEGNFSKQGWEFSLNKVGLASHNPIGEQLVQEAIRVGKTARAKGGMVISEMEIPGATIELRVAALMGEEYLVLARDITARHKLEEEIKNTLIHEKELSEMKSRFISVASHEFRTPMAAVAGSVDLLQNFSDRISPTKRAELLDRILSGVNRLKSIVDDVLTLSRADAHRVEVIKAPTDLKFFFKDVLGEAEVGDTQKHHFELEIPEEGDFARIVTDSKLLHHIFSNLISNAIRYSPAETTIKVSIGRDENQFWFRVEDEGIGIPEKDQVHLFESFFRASNVGEISGTGLGLNIVKRYSELLGGKVALIPTPKGACFQATFPIPQGAGP